MGFAVASNAELEQDCDDIWRGIYPKLNEIKGVMGERGEIKLDINKLLFYPLDSSLPFIVRIKLMAKELNFLLSKLQESLAKKMQDSGELTAREKLNLRRAEDQKSEKWLSQVK